MKTHNKHITLKDYSVSGETFSLLKDPSLDLLYTHPKPSDEELKAFYPKEGYISHSNQLKTLFDFLYHAVRYFSLRRKVRLVKPFKTKAATLLDIGAGTGYFIRAAKKSGWNVNGIEPNSVAREIANMKEANTVNCEKSLSSLEDASYDVITLWHVLEHLPNIEEDLKTFKYCLSQMVALSWPFLISKVLTPFTSKVFGLHTTSQGIYGIFPKNLFPKSFLKSR